MTPRLYAVLSLTLASTAHAQFNYTVEAENAMRANRSPVVFQDPTRETQLTVTRAGFSQLLGTGVDDPWLFPWVNVMSGVRGGWDIFMTADPASTTPGFQEIDAHVGGEESSPAPFIGLGDRPGDLFILGDARTPYYAGKSVQNSPELDFVYITRFIPQGSTIRLHGSPQDYVIAPANDPTSPNPGVAIYYEGRGTSDMIAHIDNITTAQLDLQGPIFEYASNPQPTPSIPGAWQIGGNGTEVYGDATIGADGSIYQTFLSSSTNLPDPLAGGSYRIAKYTPSGALVWLRSHGSSISGLQIGQIPFQIESTGNLLYICGGSRGAYGGPAPTVRPNSGAIAFVAQFDAITGNQLAVRQMVNNNAVTSNTWAIGIDDLGRLIAGGGTGDTPTDPADTLPWISLVNPADLSSYWTEILADPTSTSTLQLSQEVYGGVVYVPTPGAAPGVGFIYAIGYVASGDWFDSAEGVTSVWVAKFASSGGPPQWVRTFAAPFDSQYPNMIIADAEGFIYCLGQTNGPLDGRPYNGNGDAFIRKMAPDGSLVWTRLLGTTDSDDLYDAVVVGNSIYLVGNTLGSFAGTNAGKVDVWVAKIDTAGNVLDTAQFGSEQIDYGRSIDHSNGWLFIGGMTEGSIGGPNAGSTDAFVVRMDLELRLPCPGDASGDRQVDFTDITAALINYGRVYNSTTGPGDANLNATVDFADITAILEQYGTSCPS